MTDKLTGPWVLALGALAVGVAAVAARALRRHGDDETGETARRD